MGADPSHGPEAEGKLRTSDLVAVWSRTILHRIRWSWRYAVEGKNANTRIPDQYQRAVSSLRGAGC